MATAARPAGVRIVIGVLLVALMTIAFSTFVLRQRAHAVTGAREAAMHSAVTTLRQALARYKARHRLGPETLAALVREHDLVAIPTDPITHSTTTWRETREEQVSLDDFQSSSGARAPTEVIVDIRSGAAGVDAHGRRWSEY
jgi:general secretion pathway protein G